MALSPFVNLTLLYKQRLNHQSVSCHESEFQRQTDTHIGRVCRTLSNAPDRIDIIETYDSGFEPTGGGINRNHHTCALDTAGVIPASRQAD